jgi:hypothetical protein
MGFDILDYFHKLVRPCNRIQLGTVISAIWAGKTWIDAMSWANHFAQVAQNDNIEGYLDGGFRNRVHE